MTAIWLIIVFIVGFIAGHCVGYNEMRKIGLLAIDILNRDYEERLRDS